MYLVPIINLFHTLKLGPHSKESANFFNKSWVIDGTMIVEEYLARKVSEGTASPMEMTFVALPDVALWNPKQQLDRDEKKNKEGGAAATVRNYTRSVIPSVCLNVEHLITSSIHGLTERTCTVPRVEKFLGKMRGINLPTKEFCDAEYFGRSMRSEGGGVIGRYQSRRVSNVYLP